MIIYGGYTWMTAAGNPDNVDKGKRILVNAVIGLVVILISYAVVTFVINRFGAATQEPVGEEDGNGPGDGGGFEQNIFRVTGIQPHGQLRIRNVVAQISFNKAINQALIGVDNVLTNQAGVKVEKID